MQLTESQNRHTPPIGRRSESVEDRNAQTVASMSCQRGAAKRAERDFGARRQCPTAPARAVCEGGCSDGLASHGAHASKPEGGRSCKVIRNGGCRIGWDNDVRFQATRVSREG